MSKSDKQDKTVELPVSEPTVVEETPVLVECICTSPWCEAVRRLHRSDLVSVAVKNGQLLCTVSDDHVEHILGGFSGN